MIRIHKEGIKIITIFTAVLIVVNLLPSLFGCCFGVFNLALLIPSMLLLIFVLRFFRKPFRKTIHSPGIVYSPVDGTIVAIEEVEEPEYFKDKRLQVSVFMSVWNVHINWYPLSGIVKYIKYHPGKYLLARHPKSSELNERTSLVLQSTGNQEILLRQIAGYVARRVVFYSKEGQKVTSGHEMGFIKFGSRVDIFLPLGTEIKVKIGEKVKGCLSELAILA